ncbi:MAG: RDD family protein [Actinomycetota bacterium]
MSQGNVTPGWYHAEGDPPGTTRWWDGSQWVGEPQAPGQAQPGAPGGFGVGMPGAGGIPSLASAGARIGGRFIDGLIWIIIGFVTNLPVFSQTIGETIEAAEENRDPVIDVSPVLIIVTGLINLALIVAYEVLLNSRGKGTPGKRAVSARIVKEDGSELDDRTALIRISPWIALQIVGIVWGVASSGGGGFTSSLPSLLVTIAGLVMVFSDSRRQTPWDKIAKTIVVSR